MSSRQRFALFFLQWIPLLLYPPSTFDSGLPVVGFVIVALLALGFVMWRGRTWALTLSIFLQGFNVIVRLMMLLSHAVRSDSVGGGVDVPYIVTSLLAIIISLWFLYRLDRPDIRMAVAR
jgi:hypothetical protein